MKAPGKRKICDAYFQLATQKDEKTISVSALIAVAGVNRSTFYYHFKNAEDVLAYMIDWVCEQYLATITIPQGQTSILYQAEDQWKMSEKLCRFGREHAEWIQLFLSEKFYYQFCKSFCQCARKHIRNYYVMHCFPDGHTEVLRRGTIYDYYVHSVCLGIFAWLECWSERNFRENPEDFIMLQRANDQQKIYLASN